MPEEAAHTDFVTVSEASRRLELSERHVRRLAGRLPDIGRTPTGHAPMKVSLSLLSELAGKETAAPDNAGRDAGHRPDILREVIERQDREIEYLRSALEKSQALQLAALGEAAAMRGRLEKLEEQNRALIEGANGRETGEVRESETPGYSPVHEESGAERRKTTRPWWRFGRG